MSDERELIAEREKKAEEIRALGGNPYANGFTPTHTAAEIAAMFAGASRRRPPQRGQGPRRRLLISDEHFKSPGASWRSVRSARWRSSSCSTAAARFRSGFRQDLVGDAASYELCKKVERGDFVGVVGSPTITCRSPASAS